MQPKIEKITGPAITTMQPAALAEQARHAVNHARELARLDALHSRHRKPQTLHGISDRPPTPISAVRLPLGQSPGDLIGGRTGDIDIDIERQKHND